MSQANDSKPDRHQFGRFPYLTDRDRVPAPPRLLRMQRYHTVARSSMRTTPRAMWSALAAFTGLLMGHLLQSKRRESSYVSYLLNAPGSHA